MIVAVLSQGLLYIRPEDPPLPEAPVKLNICTLRDSAVAALGKALLL